MGIAVHLRASTPLGVSSTADMLNGNTKIKDSRVRKVEDLSGGATLRPSFEAD
jgi:hypothetical protein